MISLGRPSSYSQEIAESICQRLADGESLRQVCRDENIPSRQTVLKWCNDFPEFLDQYVRAREAQADLIFEELLEIADDGTNDWTERELQGGRIIEVPDHEHINRSRLRVDARKWVLARMSPKKYGEKSTVDLNQRGEMTVNVKPDYSKLSRQELKTLKELSRKALAGSDAGENGQGRGE